MSSNAGAPGAAIVNASVSAATAAGYSGSGSGAGSGALPPVALLSTPATAALAGRERERERERERDSAVPAAAAAAAAAEASPEAAFCALAQLPTNQRRLQHVGQIAVRNMQLDATATSATSGGTVLPLYNAYFVLCDRTGKRFYTSEIVYSTRNPSWRQIDFRPLASRVLRESDFSLQIYAHVCNCGGHCSEQVVGIQPVLTETSVPEVPDHAPFALAMDVSLNLYGLHFFRRQLEAEGEVLYPRNTILLHLKSGWFCHLPIKDPSTPTEKELVGNRFARVNANMVKHMYNMASLDRLNTTCATLNHVRDLCWDRRAQLERFVADERKRQRITTELERQKLKVEALRAHLKGARALIDAASKTQAQKQAELGRKQASIDALKQQLQAAQQSIAEKQEEYQRNLSQLRNIDRLVVLRQSIIILELHSIYSIETVSSDLMTIMRLELPNGTFAGCDDEQIATALGYVAHFVLMISKYQKVPLRYAIQPLASRSTITDDISDLPPSKAGRRLPLYAGKANKDRNLFQSAVDLLNDDLQQLCDFNGVPVRSARHTLPNLRRLMVHFQELAKKLSNSIHSTSPSMSGMLSPDASTYSQLSSSTDMGASNAPSLGSYLIREPVQASYYH